MQERFEIIEIPQELKNKFSAIRNIKRIRVSCKYFPWREEVIIDDEKWQVSTYKELYFILKLRNYIKKETLDKYKIFSNKEEYWCRQWTNCDICKNYHPYYFRCVFAQVHFGCDSASTRINCKYASKSNTMIHRNAILVQYDEESL